MRACSRLSALLLLCLGLLGGSMAQYYPPSYQPSGGSYYPAPAPAPAPAPVPVPRPPPVTTGARPPAAPVVATSPAPPPAREGQTFTIDWTIPSSASGVQPFGTRQVKVGDQAVFQFQGTHGLFKIPSASCPDTFTDPPLQQISAPVSNGVATVRFDTPGTFFYACPVPGHCPAGMLITFVVTA